MIETQDLHKYYGERKAIGPLSFSIEAGEIVGLLGLNGAGKTTTLRILACDLLPSSGTVRIDGLDVVGSPHEVRQRIGYLPDAPPLYDDMTVRDYLAFAARLRGMSKADANRRVPEVEEVTGIREVEDDPIASLSHGFKQRVGIAQAVVHRPRLLVLDEPITGLDPVQIVEMRELLRSLRGDHTILLSSHILSEISETCDRILVMRDGEIGASGTESELSAKLLRTFRVELTLRLPPGAYRTSSARAEAVLRELSGATRVEVLPPAEEGDGVASYRVEAERDVRDAIGQAVVGAGFGLLELRRSERELESVFLQLAGSAGRRGDAPAAGGGGGSTEAPPRPARSTRKKASGAAGAARAGGAAEPDAGAEATAAKPEAEGRALDE